MNCKFNFESEKFNFGKEIIIESWSKIIPVFVLVTTKHNIVVAVGSIPPPLTPDLNTCIIL